LVFNLPTLKPFLVLSIDQTLMKAIEEKIIQYLLEGKTTEATSVAFEHFGAMSRAEALICQITHQLTARWNNISLLKKVLYDVQTLGRGKAIIYAKAHYFDNLGVAKEYVEDVARNFQQHPHPHKLINNHIDYDYLSTEIEALMAQDKTIHAIELVRQHTLWQLKEAKAYVDKVSLLI
jgi:hypothetical protein